MTRTPPRTFECGWRYINHSSGLWSNNREIHIYQSHTTLYSTHCKLRSASQSSSLRITMPTLSLAVQRNYTRPTRTQRCSVGDWLEENKIAGIWEYIEISTRQDKWLHQTGSFYELVILIFLLHHHSSYRELLLLLVNIIAERQLPYFSSGRKFDFIQRESSAVCSTSR